MKTRTKIVVDRIVGLPLAWALNLAARFLGRVLRRDHSATPSNVRTIVISKYVGMGSIIQATPLIRSVKAAYPDARLIFLTGKSCRRLVERLEHVDAIITVDDSGIFSLGRTTLRAVSQLIAARVDLFIDLELYSAYASVVALLSLARNRIGFYRQSAEHKRGNYTHLMYFNPRSPIRHIYSQLGKLVGCEPVDPDRVGPIRVEEGDRAEVAQRFKAANVPGGRYFVVNPNASDLLVERRWPAERFAELIATLIERYDVPVVLVGAPAERLYVSGIAAAVPGRTGRVHCLAGDLSLGGLFALLQGAACFVTNDTGPMHMAWALGAPTVALFGPSDPRLYGRTATRFQSVYRPIYCSPCVHEVDAPPCLGDNVCMKRITTAEVLDRVATVLDPPQSASCDSQGLFVFYDDDLGRPLGRVVRAPG